MDLNYCPHCQVHPLVSDWEIDDDCCYVCRRYAFLRGERPIQGENEMSKIILTDSQIVRLFELVETVAAVQREIPIPPVGFASNENTRLETAKALRISLEKKNDTLIELGALLRPESEFAPTTGD